MTKMRPKYIVRCEHHITGELDWIVGVTWIESRREVLIGGPRSSVERIQWLLAEFWQPLRTRMKGEQRVQVSAFLRDQAAWERGRLRLIAAPELSVTPVRRFGRLIY